MDGMSLNIVAGDFIRTHTINSIVEDITLPDSILAVTYHGLYRIHGNGSTAHMYNFTRQLQRYHCRAMIGFLSLIHNMIASSNIFLCWY